MYIYLISKSAFLFLLLKIIHIPASTSLYIHVYVTNLHVHVSPRAVLPKNHLSVTDNLLKSVSYKKYKKYTFLS